MDRHFRSTGFWKTMPTCRLGSKSPSEENVSSPSVFVKRPEIIFSSVVLPQPDGPTRVINSPR